MTETTRSVESSGGGVLYVAFELGSTKWTIGMSPAPGQRARLRQLVAGDLVTLQEEIARAKGRFGLGPTARVVSCYEAGRDAFWLHRWLVSVGHQNLVVDSSSIEVTRRAKRAKTDRLDVAKLLTLLMRWASGERKVWSVVVVPSVAAEAARQLTREVETVREDRKRVRNRLHAVLATQGIRLELSGQWVDRLDALRTGDGRLLGAAWRARLTREAAHLAAIDARLDALCAERDAQIHAGQDRVAQVAQHLCRVRGVAEGSAAVFSAELFGTRTFANRRQVGALTGLVPVPYRSDQSVQDQGISHAGRAELRRVAVQIAWGWLRWQPDSALTQWFHRRFGGAGGRSRRIGIVAVARKLMIALWRWVEHGIVPAGAIVKAGT